MCAGPRCGAALSASRTALQADSGRDGGWQGPPTARALLRSTITPTALSSGTTAPMAGWYTKSKRSHLPRAGPATTDLGRWLSPGVCRNAVQLPSVGTQRQPTSQRKTVDLLGSLGIAAFEEGGSTATGRRPTPVACSASPGLEWPVALDDLPSRATAVPGSSCESRLGWYALVGTPGPSSECVSDAFE